MVNFDRLEALVKAKGIKKTFLSMKAGKKRGYIADAKAGHGSISAEALAIFAQELGTTVEYLTDQTDDPGTKKEPVPKGWHKTFYDEVEELNAEGFAILQSNLAWLLSQDQYKKTSSQAG